MIKNLKNPVISFLISRYITYGIHFINSILIAIYLGPVFLGIWGFINLIIQYFTRLDFGISHSVNAIASIEKKNTQYISKIIGNSIIILITLSTLIGLLLFINNYFNFDFGSKYEFKNYALLTFAVISLNYFITLFSNIFRIYNRLFEVAFSQSFFPIVSLGILIFWAGKNLLLALIVAYAITSVISLILMLVNLPVRIHFTFNKTLIFQIQKKGWYLFLYNTSFFLIFISTRTFVSQYYLISEFGLFTFAYSFANVIILLINAFTYLIWPKILNKFSKTNEVEAYKVIYFLKDNYVSLAHFMVHIAIFIYPFIIIFFPKYVSTCKAFSLMALTIVLQTNAFGFSGLLIARGKEKILGFVALGSLMINLIACYILINFFTVNFFEIIVANLISYFVFIFIVGFLGRKTLNLDSDFSSIFKDIFPWSIFIPFSLNVFLLFYSDGKLILIIPLLLFFLLNFQKGIKVQNTIKLFISKPETINF